MRRAVLLILLPAAVGAQKYQLVATTPGRVSPPSAGSVPHPTTMRKTISDVVMTQSDTAGDQLIRLVVTATKFDEIVVDSSADAAALAGRPAAGPTVLQPPITYDILVKKGKPYSLTITRMLSASAPPGASAPKPQVVVLDSLHPSMNLLVRLPGVGLLIPNSGLPTAEGATLTDRFPSHSAGSPGTASPIGGGASISLPPIDMTDTTTIIWTRNGDTVLGELKQHNLMKSASLNGDAIGTGAPRMTFNGKGEVQSASWSVSSSMTNVRTADGSVMSSSSSSSSYVITRQN